MVYWIKTEEVTHLEQMEKRGKQSIYFRSPGNDFG